MLFLIILFGLIGLAVSSPIGLLVGGGLGWWLGRRISRRLNAARTQNPRRLFRVDLLGNGLLVPSRR